MSEQRAKDWLKRQVPPHPTAYATAKIRHRHTERSTPGGSSLSATRPGWAENLPLALTVVDVASRYKEAELVTNKTAAEVADSLARIYKRSPLKWPKLLQVDPGREFMGSVSQLLAKYSVQVRRGRVDINRDQGILERFNRNLVEQLFGHQYAQEMRLTSGQRSTEWVKRLPAVVTALNGEVTRLTGKKPSEATRARSVTQNPLLLLLVVLLVLRRQKYSPLSAFAICTCLASLKGAPRSTDPIWSLHVYRLGRSVTKSDEPVLYYLLGGPQRGFVREELLVVPD
ncbi:MAG: hypothetical protein N0E48_04910 [Candidatus Thiodiazotropha endolucinida]|nr:hypothetical protein [Candidatus Thiodiazotropha taylori]MCW4342688.1 hypothetical protein [Candidatus Thiodiazotropha endolucinida]